MEKEAKKYTQLNYLQEFDFEKSIVLAGITQTREVIALRPVVENLGLNWSGAYQRIQRDEKLNQLCVSAKVISADNKSRDMVCLKPSDFQDWLWNLIPSENLNLPLWEVYKRGLVLHILEMLRVSMDEVLRLQGIETEFNLLQIDVTAYIDAHSAGKDFTRQGKEKFKEANILEKKILERMKKTNPNQLKLL